jgi:hypothetical protein
MMPVTFAPFGKSFHVGGLCIRTEHLSTRAVAGNAVTFEIRDVAR